MDERDQATGETERAVASIAPRLGQRRSVGFGRVWAAAFLALLVLSGLWSLSTPIPSGPDEPTHYVKATAVAQGTLTGERPPGFPRGTVLVRIPGSFVLYEPDLGCYYLRPEVPAGCTLLPGPDPTLQATTTYVGEYPPLYYALTGLPSLVSDQPLARRAMRAGSAVLSSVLLALALAAVVTWSRSRWLLVGWALTITPTTVYLASVLNPNGLEISAAVAAWTAGVLLVFQHAHRPPPGLVTIFAGSSAVLALTRPLSPVWVAGIVLSLALVRPAAARRLLADRAVRIGLAAIGVTVGGAVLYVVANDSLAVQRFPLPPGLSDLQVAALVLGQIPLHLRSMVGQFGAPEFTAPALAMLIWTVGVGALALAAASVCRLRDAAVLGVFAVAVLVVLPFAASIPGARTYGLVWQGRYAYPAVAGMPLLATALLADAGIRLGRAGIMAVAVVVTAHVATYYWVLRRYTVGLGSFVNAFADVPGGWDPPLPAVLLAALVAATTVASGLWLLARLARPLRLETLSEAHG